MRVRPFETGDLDHFGPLCDQFGYRATKEQIRERVAHIQAAADHALLVAEDVQGICGFVHVQAIVSIGSDPYAEIRAPAGPGARTTSGSRSVGAGARISHHALAVGN